MIRRAQMWGLEMSVLPDSERYRPGMLRQLARLRASIAAGMPRRGWKVGINVPEVLQKAGLSHSGVGWLDGHRVLGSGATITAPVASRLHVEPEIALHIGSAISPTDASDAIRASISGVSPALELVDYALPARDFDAIVESSMFHHASVLGETHPLAALLPMGADWPRLVVDGAASPAPRGDLVPADPVELLRFVALFLAEYGEALAPGDLVLSGSFCPVAVPLGIGGIGGIARAEYGPLGEVEIRRGAS